MAANPDGDRTAAFDLIVMVASLGGLQSASEIVRGLPGSFPIPVALLQHGSGSTATEPLAALLQRHTELPVRTVATGDVLAGPGLSVIPRGHTARLDPDYGLHLEKTGPGTGGDVLLRSAAETAGRRLIGVVLTGLLHDGAEGVRAVKRHGGRVLVEDPQTARAAGMPSSAIATGCVDFALPNTRIAAGLLALALAPGGADLFAVPVPAWATLGP
jgi:two-component system chemotaxis response regulator CheB